MPDPRVGDPAASGLPPPHMEAILAADVILSQSTWPKGHPIVINIDMTIYSLPAYAVNHSLVDLQTRLSSFAQRANKPFNLSSDAPPAGVPAGANNSTGAPSAAGSAGGSSPRTNASAPLNPRTAAAASSAAAVTSVAVRNISAVARPIFDLGMLPADLSAL